MSAPPGKKPEARSLRASAVATAANAEESLRAVLELEADVEALRTRYEQYFLGLARVPPAEDHQRTRGALMRLRGAAPRSAPVRFRLQTLHNRFLSYERMWSRVMREREEGTYHRDLEKARFRRKGPAEGSHAAAGGSASAAPGREQVPGSSATVGAAPRPERIAGGGASADAEGGDRSRAGDGRTAAARTDVSDERLRAVFDAYVGAKRRCGEDTKGLTYEGLAQKLRAQLPEVLARHNATSVELKVVIKGGKAMVKAIPK